MEDYAACKLLAAVKCSLAYKDIRVCMKKKKKKETSVLGGDDS